MILLWLVAALVILGFAGVLAFGAPYLPTRRTQAETALDLLDLKSGQVFYELGCGDGRVLLLAASRGLRVVGYELNPWLALLAWLRTRRHKNISVRFGNFWRADLSEADGIYVFLLDRYMTKLDKKISALNRPVKLASYAFKIPDKKPVAQKSAMFLYRY